MKSPAASSPATIAEFISKVIGGTSRNDLLGTSCHSTALRLSRIPARLNAAHAQIVDKIHFFENFLHISLEKMQKPSILMDMTGDDESPANGN